MIVKAGRPKSLLRNSILMPSLAASIMNGKYVNGLPLYRISQEFLRNDIHISKQVMVNWMIQCADRYLGFCTIISIRNCISSMCCRQMKLLSWYPGTGVLQTARAICGSTARVRTIRIHRSSCINTRGQEKRSIPKDSSKNFKVLLSATVTRRTGNWIATTRISHLPDAGFTQGEDV